MSRSTFSGPVRSLAGFTPSVTSATLSFMLSARASLDFASIAAQSSSDLTITVPGAVITNFVVMDLPAALAPGLVFNAFVSADNTVTVRANNFTALGVNPPALTFGVLVIGLT
jgi:hypothetical protein